MKVVYLKVLKDVLCESVEIEWLVDYVILWIQCRYSECQVKCYIKKKISKNEKKKESFC